MNARDISEGDGVAWEYGSGLAAGRSTGEVLEMGAKGGDVMRVRSDKTGDVALIRPEDVTEVFN